MGELRAASWSSDKKPGYNPSTNTNSAPSSDRTVPAGTRGSRMLGSSGCSVVGTALHPGSATDTREPPSGEAMTILLQTRGQRLYSVTPFAGRLTTEISVSSVPRTMKSKPSLSSTSKTLRSPARRGLTGLMRL